MGFTENNARLLGNPSDFLPLFSVLSFDKSSNGILKNTPAVYLFAQKIDPLPRCHSKRRIKKNI